MCHFRLEDCSILSRTGKQVISPPTFSDFRPNAPPYIVITCELFTTSKLVRVGTGCWVLYGGDGTLFSI